MEIEKENPNFKSCDDCIYSNDIEPICFLRRCIHVVSRLKECYVPKLSITESVSEIIGCKECIHRAGKPISDGRFWCTIHGCFMYYCSDAEKVLPIESNSRWLYQQRDDN